METYQDVEKNQPRTWEDVEEEFILRSPDNMYSGNPNIYRSNFIKWLKENYKTPERR